MMVQPQDWASSLFVAALELDHYFHHCAAVREGKLEALRSFAAEREQTSPTASSLPLSLVVQQTAPVSCVEPPQHPSYVMTMLRH